MKKGLLSQETFTETPLRRKQHVIVRVGEAAMRKTFIAVAFISALLLSALAGTRSVDLGRADPYIADWVKEGEVAPPSGSKPPTVSIFSPGNNTAFASYNVSLNFSVSGAEASNVSLRLAELYYRASWQQLKNVSVWSPLYYSLPVQLSVNLTSVPRGSHWLEVYAVAEGWITTRQEITHGIFFTTYYVVFRLVGSSVVSFAVDMTPPSVTVLSLQSKAYGTSDVPLKFTVNEPVTQSRYSLDGQDNVTVAGNTTLTGLSVGEHTVTVYAADVAGNVGSSGSITFTVAEPGSFPTAPVAAASVATVVEVAGLLVYFKKRKR
jgi:hypothetical protein